MIIGQSSHVLITDLSYRGSWNASTNSPVLTSGVGTRGYTYKVSVSGTTNVDGINSWAVGDIITFNGTSWEKFAANFIPNLLGEAANAIYVSLTGSDATGDGTMGRPLRTVSAALLVATSGDTIMILPGTYVENLTLKAGINLSSFIPGSVFITGNHTLNIIGSVSIWGVTLQSSSGTTLTLSGTGAQTLQMFYLQVLAGTGDAINWSNTNASSSLSLDSVIVFVSGNGASRRTFNSSSSSQGTVTALRTTFRKNDLDATSLNIFGSLIFNHSQDRVEGQTVVQNSAVLNSTRVTHKTATVPVLNTTSTGMTTFTNCTDDTSAIPAVIGTGAFSYGLVFLAGTGSGSSSILNGGIGSIVINHAPIKIRSGQLKPIPQDGLIEHDSTGFYVTQGVNRWNLVPTVGSPVASASSITPTGQIFHVTGSITINTIVGGVAGQSITLLPDAVFSLGTAGNIAVASTSVVGKALRLIFDGSLWYPSY